MVWWYQCMLNSIIPTEITEVLCSTLWAVVTDYLFGQSKTGKNSIRVSTVELEMAERKGITSILIFDDHQHLELLNAGKINVNALHGMASPGPAM